MASRYSNISKEISRQGTEYLVPVIYPEVKVGENDIYIITTESDRFDVLSLHFYGTTQYWWVIMAANMEAVRSDSLAVPPGTQIRIPENPEDYVVNYQNLNSLN